MMRFVRCVECRRLHLAVDVAELPRASLLDYVRCDACGSTAGFLEGEPLVDEVTGVIPACLADVGAVQ